MMKTLLAASLLALASLAPRSFQDPEPKQGPRMQLGNFSVSLAVKDLKASRAFYEKLGFEKVGGVEEQNWLVLKNDTTKIGLFQGMFEQNILTFNPGWDHSGGTLESFQDVRELHATLKERGLAPMQEAGLDGDGPASFVLVDPDGNPVLVDQHVPKPSK